MNSPCHHHRPLLLAALLLAAGCAAKYAEDIAPMGQMDFYGNTLSLPFEQRILPMPENLLEIYRQLDGRPGYKAHTPTAGEKELIIEYLRLLPPAFEKLFRERCVGLYLMDDFVGNGLASWVVDRKGRRFFQMTLNRAALSQPLSATLTERERSCFIPQEGWDVKVEAGKVYRGLAYALFHEGTHAVDYVYNITPDVDPDFPMRLRAAALPDGGLFTGVWQSPAAPFARYDYIKRGLLTFYGLGGGPRIPAGETPEVYGGLAGSPFISLYGSKTCAEDFADLIAYHMIVERLGQPYRITLSRPGGRETSYEPIKGPAGARARAAMEFAQKNLARAD